MKSIKCHRRYTGTASDNLCANPLRVREAVVAGGRRFQDEAARYEKPPRGSERRNTGSSKSPAARANFFCSQDFENSVVWKYATFDIESEYDIYFDIKTVLIRGVFIWKPIFPQNESFCRKINSISKTNSWSLEIRTTLRSDFSSIRRHTGKRLWYHSGPHSKCYVLLKYYGSYYKRTGVIKQHVNLRDFEGSPNHRDFYQK